MLRAELGQVSYKDGWEFVLYQHRWEGVWLAITATLPDSYHPGEVTTVTIRSAVPPMQTYEQFHDWIMWRLVRIEVHEMREFYKVGGVVVDDPHRADANE